MTKPKPNLMLQKQKLEKNSSQSYLKWKRIHPSDLSEVENSTGRIFDQSFSQTRVQHCVFFQLFAFTTAESILTWLFFSCMAFTKSKLHARYASFILLRSIQKRAVRLKTAGSLRLGTIWKKDGLITKNDYESNHDVERRLSFNFYFSIDDEISGRWYL